MAAPSYHAVDARESLARLHAYVSRTSLALRKLASAASAQLGRDCFMHAELGRALLNDFNIHATTVIGYAAWRIGPGDGDVIRHVPQGDAEGYDGGAIIWAHAWLESAGLLIDFTTYQLPLKARELDASDGGTTKVDWKPDFLLLPRQDTRSFQEVAQSLEPGVAYYEARPELGARLRPQLSLDREDLQLARLILNNPELNVRGPNDLKLHASLHR